MNNELVEIATAELKQHGIKPEVTHTNGGHIQITWRVVPEKELRCVTTAKTGSDWRNRMNIRADVRRLLRADNVTLKREEPKPKKHPTLAKALSLPKEVVPIPDQLAALRGEVADLTELMVRTFRMVGNMRETIAAQAPPPPPPPAPLSSRSVKIKEFLALDRWVSLSALARDTGLTPQQVKLKLYYLERLGEVSVYQGQAKLNAVEPRPKKPRGRAAAKLKAMAAKAPAKAKKKTNGHRHAA
ncbi:hypothetical protein [Bradyrhizobium japonicum]|uniref:hypothetical protein n=1 Tax=Bradyrhizobium japonicum TaxID=375 RepID=UPI001E514A63|nr:hypothetical protein [Bradyrhizobium japonicum]MCD9821227.1 hypothetical protein [Bradyrhizobium japonicum]MEB2674077.1 hypothetical protein [Bradyrhizobium japonicum]WRI93263.1 hypothetical protein R3F75_20960 [Bradyrhizobium japonicum]